MVCWIFCWGCETRAIPMSIFTFFNCFTVLMARYLNLPIGVAVWIFIPFSSHPTRLELMLKLETGLGLVLSTFMGYDELIGQISQHVKVKIFIFFRFFHSFLSAYCNYSTCSLNVSIRVLILRSQNYNFWYVTCHIYFIMYVQTIY